MYTYEMFEIDGVFTLFRPLFITMLLLSILLFIAIILPKVRKRYINTFTVVSISIVTVLLSTQLLFMDGIIVDELNLDGDKITFYVFIATVGISFVNIISYFISQNRD
ncbi:acyl-CoA dehydrogenase [Viridibacillus arvi]|uniref:acyl-CoA dehydrogenase n=1 Tax=Viridibacillus arvi TaxID=263475 RepID=UPI003690F5CA